MFSGFGRGERAREEVDERRHDDDTVALWSSVGLKRRLGRCRHHTHLYARRRTFFSCAHRCAVHSLIRTLPMFSHRHCLKIQGISVHHFSKPLSSLRHVLVRCAFCSFLSCRSISYLLSVTTFSVDHIFGEDQINHLLLCSMEWNGCLANPIPNTGEALATSTSFEVGRAMVVRDLGDLWLCPTSAGKRERYRHTGSEVTYIVGHPTVVCLVTEAAPRTHQNGQLTELGYQLVLRKTYIV